MALQKSRTQNRRPATATTTSSSPGDPVNAPEFQEDDEYTKEVEEDIALGDDTDVEDDEDEDMTVEVAPQQKAAAPVVKEKSKPAPVTNNERPWELVDTYPRDGVTFGPNDPLDVVGVQNGTRVTITVPHYQARRVPNSATLWQFMLRFPAAHQIARDRVRSVREKISDPIPA